MPIRPGILAQMFCESLILQLGRIASYVPSISCVGA